MMLNEIQYILGETQKDVQLETLAENRNTAVSLVQQAHTSIDIFTQNMDAEIYDNKIFEESIFSLAKRHPNTQIRILAQDTKRAVQNGHCLIRLAQSLTSSVMIHNPSREHADQRINFMIADRVGLLYRAASTQRNYCATFNFKSPQRALELADFFNNIWQHSTPDAQTRRIYV
jgi:hypothetical protein